MRPSNMSSRLAVLSLMVVSGLISTACSVESVEPAPSEADLTQGRPIYAVSSADVVEQFGDNMWSDLVSASASHPDVRTITKQSAKVFATAEGLFLKNFFEFLGAELEAQTTLDVAELRESINARAEALAKRELTIMRAGEVVDWAKLYGVKENRPRLRKYFEAFEQRATTKGFMKARAAGRYQMATNAEVWGRVRGQRPELFSRILVPVQFAAPPSALDLQRTFRIEGTMKERGAGAPDKFFLAPRGVAGDRFFEPLLELAKKAGIAERYYFEDTNRTTLVLVDSLQQAWGFEIGEPSEDYPSFRTLSGSSPE